MENCLITKLKSIVDNNKLEVYDSMMVEIKEDQNGLFLENVYALYPERSISALDGLFDVYGDGAQLIEENKTSFTNTSGGVLNVYLKKKGHYAFHEKTSASSGLRKTTFSGLGYGGRSYVNFDSLNYAKGRFDLACNGYGTLKAKTLQDVYFLQIDVVGASIDFDGASFGNHLEYCKVFSSNVINASIDVFKEAPQMTEITFRNTNQGAGSTNNNLEVLFDYWHNVKGKNSGSIAVVINNSDAFTLNGQSTINATVEFSGSGWNVIS